MVHVSTQSKLESLFKRAFEAVRARPLYGIGVCMLLLVPPSVLGVWGLSRALHYGEVLPGVWVNEYAAAGMTPSELEADLSRAAARLNQRPVRVHLEGAVFNLDPKEVGAKVDVAGTARTAVRRRTRVGVLFATVVVVGAAAVAVSVDVQRRGRSREARGARGEMGASGDFRSAGAR